MIKIENKFIFHLNFEERSFKNHFLLYKVIQLYLDYKIQLKIK